MSDTQIVKACAAAMSLHLTERNGQYLHYTGDYENMLRYDPLHDDAQAMALVKKFGGHINSEDAKIWCVEIGGFGIDEAADLNRAICECVAHIQAAK